MQLATLAPPQDANTSRCAIRRRRDQGEARPGSGIRLGACCGGDGNAAGLSTIGASDPQLSTRGARLEAISDERQADRLCELTVP